MAQNGFAIFSKYLDYECIEEHQVAYNVIGALWILSVHEFAQKGFEEAGLDIIEKVAKILDYFNKEKIVRIVLLLFDVTFHHLFLLELENERILPWNNVRYQHP